MTANELLQVELSLWKSIAASRERQNETLSRYFDVAIEIANFWRDKVDGPCEYPSELAAKIKALDPAQDD